MSKTISPNSEQKEMKVHLHSDRVDVVDNLCILPTFYFCHFLVERGCF